MRKIKFRAWDKSRNIMIYPYEDDEGINVWWNETGYLEITQEFNDVKELNSIFNSENFILQQYTESKDRNGGEIYEGDILRYCGLNYEVKWDKDCWTAFCPNYNKYHWPKLQYFFRDSSCSSIIGNIFENPELLK